MWKGHWGLEVHGPIVHGSRRPYKFISCRVSTKSLKTFGTHTYILLIPIKINIPLRWTHRDQNLKTTTEFHFLQLEKSINYVHSLPSPFKHQMVQFFFPSPTTERGHWQKDPNIFRPQRMPWCFISRRPVRQIALGRKADHISRAYLPPSGSGQPWSPWDVHGEIWRNLTEPVAWASLRPPCPRHWTTALSPACDLGSSASSPPLMTLCCHFPTTYYCLSGIQTSGKL